MSPRPESITGGDGHKPGFYRSNSDQEGKQSESESEKGTFKMRSKEEEERWRAFLRQDYPVLGIPQKWVSRIFMVVNHVLGVYGLYLVLTGYFSFGILLFEFVYNYCGALGTTIGAHRLWTHKAFKATKPLKILLMCWQSITVQYSLYKWCLDHRIHHKFTDTPKDPHNSKRGFWFSHMFWTMTKRHPEHLEQLKTFDMPDLEKDEVILFQAKWYPWLVFLFYNFIPVRFICLVWGLPRFQVNCLNCLRWCYGLHISAAVNSFAHMFGDKPFDKDITSTDNKIVALFSVGEGWHNYHHTFPWDYRASELGWKINFSTMLIDFFAWIGWAHDLKTVSPEMLKEKVKRSGDGSHENYGTFSTKYDDLQVFEDDANQSLKMNCDSSGTWGWGDANISDEFRKMTTILKPEIILKPGIESSDDLMRER